MLTAGKIFLGIAALGLLLLFTHVGVVGMCTDTPGALSLLAVIAGTPLGLLFLALAAIAARRQKAAKPSDSGPHTSSPKQS